MKVLIAGGRDFHNSPDENIMKEHHKLGLELLEDVKKRYDITFVISGKAKGGDLFGELWAKSNDISILEYPANWDRYGKRAGILRNEDMGNDADRAIIFWDRKSKGTAHMINYMKKLNKPYNIVYYNDRDIFDEF